MKKVKNSCGLSKSILSIDITFDSISNIIEQFLQKFTFPTAK